MPKNFAPQPASPNENSVVMTRADLENIPVFALPSGFSMRPYQAGDDQTWWHIHELADPLLMAHRGGSHRQFFGDDERELRARQMFLLAPDGQPIGTATAWSDSDQLGRVHWVAIVPQFQGRGLAKPLVSRILILLRELGHTRAILDTSNQRPRAISLYQRMGFAVKPEPDS